MTAIARPRIDIQSVFQLTELADYIIPYTIRAICDLGVADHLTDGPRTVTDLAGLVGAHAPSLHRALRALASKGIFTETEPGVFELTPLAQPLRADHPASLRDAYPLLAADIDAWALFDHSIRTGEAAFDKAHGQDYATYMAENPVDRARFDAAKQAATRLELRTVLPGYDWAALRTLADVGADNDTFVTGLTEKFPELHGSVTDPADIPSELDGYLLRRVLYSQDDEHVLRLFGALRAAMRPDSRLLIIEPVIQPGNDFDVAKLYDLMLLCLIGAGTRSRDRIEHLLAAAGLRLVNVLPTMLFPIIEARLAD